MAKKKRPAKKRVPKKAPRQIELPVDRRSTGTSEPTWLIERGRQQQFWKGTLSRHATNKFLLKLPHGAVVQLASGTQSGFVMDEIIRFQIAMKKALDLVILTTHLQILEKGRDAKFNEPTLFESMQLVLTGGSLHFSLHSLVGEYAATQVANAGIEPDVVFMGAKGLSTAQEITVAGIADFE